MRAETELTDGPKAQSGVFCIQGLRKSFRNASIFEILRVT
jgi:hypothetical protein